MTAEPPLLAVAVQVTVAALVVPDAVAVPLVGAPGVPTVIAAEAADEAPVPLAFLAATVKV